MRSKNMQVLTKQGKKKRPGVTIYGIGDDPHKLQTSGHNEDDTPGVKAEDQDSDNIPEHRALDFMIGPNFTPADAEHLFQDLTTIPENQNRLLYVIYNRRIRSRKNGWVERPYEGKNPHTDHVHASGEADDDANESPWILSDWGPAPGQPSPPWTPPQLTVDGELGPKTIRRWQQVMGTKVDGEITPKRSDLVRAVQRRLKDVVDRSLVVDGDGIYQNGRRYKTVIALQRYLGVPVDGVLSTPKSETIKALQRRLNDNRF